MIWHIGVHGSNHRDFVDALGNMWKQITDFNSALAMLPKSKWGGESRTRLSLRLWILLWEKLSGVLLQQGLRVKRIHVRRPAIHEQVNHSFRFPVKLRGFWCDGIQRT